MWFWQKRAVVEAMKPIACATLNFRYTAEGRLQQFWCWAHPSRFVTDILQVRVPPDTPDDEYGEWHDIPTVSRP